MDASTVTPGQDPAPTLTFDEEKHRYYWGGKYVPNVTRIIEPWTDWSRIPPEVLERARQRGKARHKMVEADSRGTTHLYEWPDWITGARRAWDKCKAETGFTPWFSEQQLYHRIYGYAGTADLFGEFTKLKDVNGCCNVDVKGSDYAGPAIGLQLAAYTGAWNDEAPKELHVPWANRFALILKDNGTYQLLRFPDRDDWIDFLAALRQWKFKEKNYGSNSAK